MSEQYTTRLKARLTQQKIPSFRALARQADVSDWSVRQLREGRAAQLRGWILVQLATALDYSLSELLSEFSEINLPCRVGSANKDNPSTPQTPETWQRQSLDAIESWLRQWPTVTAAIAKNPNLPATRILPLLKPLDTLLEQWGVDAIATVGEVLPYDPQWHQLLEGTAQPGESVRVRYVGYQHQGKLLFRAQVSPQ